MSDVLLSFGLSLLAVSQALTSLVQDSIEQGSSDNLTRGADICSWKSSAKDWCMIECDRQRFYIYDKKHRTMN